MIGAIFMLFKEILSFIVRLVFGDTSPLNSESEPTPSNLVYMPFDRFCEMNMHCESFKSESEVMGYLIGDTFSDTKGQYTRIFKSITGSFIGTSVAVQFTKLGIGELNLKLQNFQNSNSLCPIDNREVFNHICSGCGYDLRDTKFIGWYHSHPGLGVFMSERDLSTQREYFNEPPCNVAIVIDPVNREYGIWQTSNGSISEALLCGY
jgi:proteasome lid subunit RPN8/RPN11